MCPSCGAHHVPAAGPTVEAGARAGSFTGKTGWRGKGFKRPDPLPDAVPATVATDDTTDEDTPDEALGPVPDEDVVLEPEPEETDVSGLVGHDRQPKEP